MRLLDEGYFRPVASRHHGGAGRPTASGPIVDFSANVNPYGPSPRVAAAAREAPLRDYPDPTARAVRDAIAQRIGRAADDVVFGNGATELLWTLARAALGPRSRVVVVEPAFAELRAAALSVGAAVHAWRASPHDDFAIDLEAVAAAVDRADADVLYVADPSSPAGRPAPIAEIAALAAARPVLCVLLDESFASLGDRPRSLATPLPPNVVRVRSLTKDHAIAGVRAGYLVGPAALVRQLEACRPAWTTNAVAQAIALAALGDDAFVAASRARIHADRRALEDGLRARGLRPVPSSAPYLVVDVGDAARLTARLASRGVLVRDCTSFGLPSFIRLAARPALERAHLFTALDAALTEATC